MKGPRVLHSDVSKFQKLNQHSKAHRLTKGTAALCVKRALPREFWWLGIQEGPHIVVEPGMQDGCTVEEPGRLPCHMRSPACH